MGMYSWTDYNSIQIRHGMREAFIKYVEDLKLESRPDWPEYGAEHAKVIIIDPETDDVEIQIDSWKIISYWYNDTLDFFDGLSKYLDGELGLTFETPQEHAIIHFTPEGTRYEIGMMKYDIYGSEELRHKEE